MKKFIYILFILIFIPGVAELGLRLSGNYLTYSEKTSGKYESDFGSESQNIFHTWGPNSVFNLDKGEYNYLYQINQLGFREREFMLEDTSRNNVFVFGDSFIEGAGAPYDSTFTRFLERFLNADGLSYNVYNFGVSGADPFFNMTAYNQLAVVKPSHVIFSINDSDLYDYMSRGGFERFSEDGQMVRYREAPGFHEVYRKSHLARFIIIEVLGYDANFVRKKDFPEKEAEAAEMIAECLSFAKLLSDENSIKFMALVHPFPHAVCTTSDPYAPGESTLGKSLADIPVIHLSQKMAQTMRQENCESYSWPVDGHFNSKGYELMAKTFYNQVNEQYPGIFNQLDF